MSFQETNPSPTLGSMYISFPIIGTIKIVIPQKTDNPAVSKNIFLVFFFRESIRESISIRLEKQINPLPITFVIGNIFSIIFSILLICYQPFPKINSVSAR